MAAVLQSRDAGARQARRILRSQVRKGLKKLDGEHAASDADIHDARKRIKQARATLRLLRAVLPRTDYLREDRALRGAARPLSVARDAKVLVDALDVLSQQYRGARHIKGAQRFRRALVRARGQARRRTLTDASGVHHSLKLMHRARARADRWSLGHDSWAGLISSAVRLYAEGRAALQDVRAEPTVERLHRWRKLAKYLYLQLEVLAPVCAPAVGRMARQLHALTDDLGDDHDLAVLREAVAAHTRDFASDAGATLLMTLIERSRTNLQRGALLRGGRLYRPTAARFGRTLGV
jgi:CHAD domain-containing protein